MEHPFERAGEYLARFFWVRTAGRTKGKPPVCLVRSAFEAIFRQAISIFFLIALTVHASQPIFLFRCASPVTDGMDASPYRTGSGEFQRGVLA